MTSASDDKTANATIGAFPSPIPAPTFTSAISGPHVPPMKLLSSSDLIEVCQKIGAPPSRCRIEPTIPPSDTNTPKDVPSGLYKEVIASRTKSQRQYWFMATLYNTCIVLQLLLGAALTALGSSDNSTSHRLAITILAAGNTVNAGIIALLHNSGLPNRLKQDWNEYAKVEAFLEELMYTGLVGVNETKVDAVAKCWDMYATAKATIEKNKPEVYTTASSAQAVATSV